MLKRPLISKANLDTLILALLGLAGLYELLIIEQNIFFKIGIIALFLFSLWRIYYQDSGPILYLITFILLTILFRLTSIQATFQASVINIIIAFILIVFLFSYRHRDIFGNLDYKFWGYGCMLAFLVSEIFLILTFFPIEIKSKSILIVLFIWIYDEVIIEYKLKKLPNRFIILIMFIFSLVFTVLTLTFPFKIGF
jgi:hypothetical protein